MDSIYHEGEQKVQEIIGEINVANANGRVIAGKIIKGAFNFINAQQMVIVSSTGENDRVWASLLMGKSGFMTVVDEKNVLLDYSLLQSTKRDIFFRNINTHHKIGMLFIELLTRRRYRLNGKVTVTGAGLNIEVIEAYPNCPKYIQRRKISFSKTDGMNEAQQHEGTILGHREKEFIKNADTLFVGSSGISKNMDASHRGGAKGFVEILENGVLKIPDYQGNSMYNTLGNFVLNPHAGVLFIDFQQGTSLQLSGTASLLFDQSSEEDLQKTTGTGRYWLFETEKWILTEQHHRADWEFIDFSPFNP